MLNCSMSAISCFLLLTYTILVGTKNHAYFIVFITTSTACVLTFDYLVWIKVWICDSVSIAEPPGRSSSHLQS